ncbi:DUF3596 domain-containing protein, partial [Escherichia coli]
MREVEMKYPTGVENHGGKLRIWFVYKGVRVRENLGVPDTAKNGNDSNLLIVFYVQIMPDDFVMQLHR